MLPQSSGVQFSCFFANSSRFFLVCLRQVWLLPFNLTSNNLLLTVWADIFLFAPSLSSTASSEEVFLLSARDALFKDLSSLAVVEILQPCPFLFLKDFVSLYLLIVVWTPFLEHSIFLAISTWEYPSPDKATL